MARHCANRSYQPGPPNGLDWTLFCLWYSRAGAWGSRRLGSPCCCCSVLTMCTFRHRLHRVYGCTSCVAVAARLHSLYSEHSPLGSPSGFDFFLTTRSCARSLHRIISYSIQPMAAATYDCVRRTESVGMAGVMGPRSASAVCQPVAQTRRGCAEACLVCECVSEAASLELTTLRRPTSLHLARLFASSSIKFRACLLKASTPSKSRHSPLDRSNQVNRVLSWVPSFQFLIPCNCSTVLSSLLQLFTSEGQIADQQNPKPLPIRRWLFVATSPPSAPGRSISIGPRPFEMQHRGWASGQQAGESHTVRSVKSQDCRPAAHPLPDLCFPTASQTKPAKCRSR